MSKAVLTATAFGYTNIAWKVYKGLSKPAPDPDRNREFIYLYGRTDPLLTNYKQCLAMIQTKNLNYKRRHSTSILKESAYVMYFVSSSTRRLRP